LRSAGERQLARDFYRFVCDSDVCRNDSDQMIGLGEAQLIVNQNGESSSRLLHGCGRFVSAA
jgi:hypothetical protein